jgi:hypothetical protein
LYYSEVEPAPEGDANVALLDGRDFMQRDGQIQGGIEVLPIADAGADACGN